MTIQELRQTVDRLEQQVVTIGRRANAEADWNPSQARFLRDRMWSLEAEASDARVALCAALAGGAS